MNKSALLELASRCEAATGPDRKLDLAIAVAINRDDIFDTHYEWRWGLGGDEIEAWKPDKRKPSGYLDPEQFCPRVSASLDAAMSLLARKTLWAVGSMEEGPFARLCWPQPNGTYIGGYHEATAASAPLAICAAALRALAKEKGE
jgi:hypothetical protein